MSRPPLRVTPAQRVMPVLVSIVMFMEFMDVTIINTAVPSIARSFHTDPILLKFSVTSYFLSLAIFMPISGWCADKFGTKKIFLGAISLFAFASLLCGLSQNVIELTVYRFLQGMGGAFMNPVSRIIIMRLFPLKDLVRIQSYIFTPALVGFVAGPFVGGMITTYLSWHWIFYVNIPIALIVIYFGMKLIQNECDPQVKKFDFLGFILCGVSLGAFTLAVDMLGHPEVMSPYLVWAIGMAGIFLFIILIFYVLKKKNPVLNFLLLSVKTFRIGFFSNMTMNMMSASIAFLLPLFFQEQFHLTPARAGTLILPIAVGQISTRALVSRLIYHFGFRNMMTVSAFLTLCCVLALAQMPAPISEPYIIVIGFCLGAVQTMNFSSTGALNYVDIPKEKIAAATSLDLTSRQFFASCGIGISAGFLSFLLLWHGAQLTEPQSLPFFRYAFYLLAVFPLSSLLVALCLGKNDGAHALQKTPSP